MHKVHKKLKNKSKHTIKHEAHVVCSPYKTASSSVEQALLDLGVGSKAMPYSPNLRRKHSAALFEWNRLANRSISFEHFSADYKDVLHNTFSPYVAELSKYDVFADAPFGHTHTHVFLRKILAPRAVLIWVNRELDSWISSVKRWELTHPNVYAEKIRTWEADPTLRINQLISLWNRSYEQFQRIGEAFPDDCLELEWADLQDYGALANFYGVEAPDQPFPARNVNTKEC